MTDVSQLSDAQLQALYAQQQAAPPPVDATSLPFSDPRITDQQRAYQAATPADPNAAPGTARNPV